ncbi:MAG: TIR domain-containing protein [Hyphomonas sp.]|uniref:toll/interleukin-1 receptor domain-containing protein n=1 Tax=Hyphomonas sp. TaxID=87 RepID=UPI0017EBB568|nr:toll/interleukin-1 receptor domain-containing protein [Hyphomonas sp.]MBU3920860.1 TIR domain-containing protein [Alphaproteobacteria bacterium]MBA3068351.1 TIR domain-containing protein [Hyphomonas sp.]MBU4060783.1 TIR domain-containing protein [Alphaproteobacteria bacterium]MBU4164767.1 TIR domain-containing protein [Alphaproteobacteria bacterium]MBU4567944.1 TIR domain-containing protein [Alphaproteobacteria bacterium]
MTDPEFLADRIRYFADPAAPQGTLNPGARGDHCRNIQLALMILGFDENARHEPLGDQFTPNISADLKRFQAARGHTSIDGLCGPGTRALLVNTLLERAEAKAAGFDPFARMQDPERRAEGSAFISYARAGRHEVARLCRLTQSWGYDAWYDADISGGERFSQTLMQRIEAAYLVLVFETAAAVTSEWVRRELECAEAAGKRILPIEIEPVGTDHALAGILMSHHRIGPAPADLEAPGSAAYRAALRQAFRDAHRQHIAH